MNKQLEKCLKDVQEAEQSLHQFTKEIYSNGTTIQLKATNIGVELRYSDSYRSGLVLFDYEQCKQINDFLNFVLND